MKVAVVVVVVVKSAAVVERHTKVVGVGDGFFFSLHRKGRA